MNTYVAGLLFDDVGTNVALITKNKPEWQKGKINAIGGKVEEHETFIEAMWREFEEETGVPVDEWFQFLILTGSDYEVRFFSCFDKDMLSKVTTKEDEEVFIYNPSNLPSNVIPNIRWIVPMALNKTNFTYKVREGL